MKNTKKLLILVLALIALTLAMSISIFAEESTEPATCEHTYDWNIVGCPKCGTLATLDEDSTNVSSNLGYTIYFATSLNDLSNTNYDVIRLKNNISLPSGGKITNPNAIIDLGGNVLYRNGGYLGLRIVSAKGFVNGYVYKTNGGSQIMAVTSLEFMEDVTLCANSTKTNNATGLLMNTAGAYLGSMKNVTICAGVLNDLNSNNFDFVNVGTNGIYNHGIEATQGTIGSMENVKISTYGQAITTAAKIGTMTNCVFSGDNIAFNVTTLQSEMKFVDCEIHSKNLAIYIANAVESTEEAPVDFDLGNTTIITDGAVFDISSHISGNEMFNELTTAVASVNGQLYTSLADAVNALKASKEEVTTFALIGNLAVDETIVIDKKVNFSFGGASYDVPVYGTNQVTNKTVSGYTVTSSVDVVFSVVEGGDLTVSGAGKLIGSENAILADGGEILIAAGTYEGYNPREFVSTESCVVNTDGVYTIASEHDYDDEVGADKTTYQVDGVCNNCGYVRGIVAVDNVYYATIEEAKAAALTSGKAVVLAADIVIDGEETWDLTGVAFNFNGCTVTGDLNIVGGTFSADVTDYLDDAYCCKYNSQTKQYEVISHIWADATCAAPKTCTNCGATEGETLPHTWTEATCTEPKTCSACGATEGEALGHNYVAGEEVDGKTVYTCSNCGDSYSCIHNFAIVESADATCTEAGYIVYECAECGTIKTEATGEAALGHEYSYETQCCVRDCGHEFNVLEVSTWADLHKALNNKTSIDYDVVRLAASVEVGYHTQNNIYDHFIYVKAPIIIDLNGKTITTNEGYAPFYMQNSESSLVNGIIDKIGGGRQALRLDSVKLVEKITINNTSSNTGVTGIIINAGPIGTLRNVTVNGAGNHGIEAQNNACVIDLMDNVVVTSNGQAMTLAARINKITNCTFDGKNIGLSITNLIGNIYLENTKVIGGGLAVRIDAAIASEGNTASFSYDSNSTISTLGVAFYVGSGVKDNQYCTLSTINTAVALVNGIVYNDLDKAVAALMASTEDVTTFALINDLVVTEAIVIDKNVNFSLGGGQFMVPKPGYNTGEIFTVSGYTITCPEDTNGDGIFHVVEGGVLILSGDGTVNSVGNNIYNIAVWADGGEVIINGGTYTNVGEGLTEDHYDLIYVKNGGSVVINGGTFIAQTPKWTLNLNDSTEGSIVVNGGNFYAYNPAASETEPGGACSFMAEGKCLILVEEGDLAGYYVVGEHIWVDATCTEAKTCSVCGATEGEALGHTYGEWVFNAETVEITRACQNGCGATETKAVVATANGEYYETLASAILAGGEVVLLKDIEINSMIEVSKDNVVTLDLNGKTITGKDTTSKNFSILDNRGTLTINDTVGGGKFTLVAEINSGWNRYSAVIANNPGGKLTVNGGTIEHLGGTDMAYGIDNLTNGKGTYAETIINGGVVKSTYRAIRQFLNGIEAQNILTINGGTIEGANKSIFFHDPSKNANSGTLTISENATIVGDIYLYVTEGSTEWPVEVSIEAEATVLTANIPNGYAVLESEGKWISHKHVAGEAVVENKVDASCSANGSYDKVVYCTVCDAEISRETVETEKAAHTEEEIPAVPGEVKNPGMTSGIKCSVCGEVLKAPVTADGDFRMASVSLSLGENIGIVYKAQVPEGYENVYMVFQMTVVENGEEVVKEFTVTGYEIDQTNGRYCFTFSGVRLQWMADLVTATVYAEKDGVVSANSYSNYSVKTYILSQLGKSTNSATLKTMLSDLLILGAKTQIYANYKADNLMTADVDASLLTPSTYAGVPSDEFVQKMITNDENTRNIADWKAVSLTFKDAMSYQFKLAIDPTALEDIKIVVTIPVPGKAARVDEYTAEDLVYDAENDRYVLSVDNVKALQYGETVVGDIYYQGAKISRTVNYSVNSYIQKNQDSTNVGLRDFLRAVYLYGEAVRIYTGN